MADRKITGILIDVWNETAEVKTITADLDTYYRTLNCSTITITARRIGYRSRKYYDIICDDEGLLVAPTKVSALGSMNRPELVGNLFICSHDEEGNEKSLTAADIKKIKNHIFHIRTNLHPQGYPMLCDVCY